MNRVRTRHNFFTLSGITARALLFSVRYAKEPYDMLLAGSYGVVEILGAKRYFKILSKAVRHQLKEFTRANTNAKRGARVNPSNQAVSKPG